ncbi:CRISPR-associated endonuclease/helicase Cas3 [Salinibacter ruber]|uniref:CRISPR-associated helicase Cas3' n=1 Tax=Salinibacter ruber TaxID=146919 RepID=UPI002169FAF1|nr:CRISPR-associated helicase Cas3' [Salinibacter ruber]MCS3831130.1 CRISPR-associated endonuclease/helicase Cas3 [Salinibacter ruber]
MTLLAKSPDQGGLTLEEHTRHVVEAMTHMGSELDVAFDVARRGAILHDLGKGHPFFQAMVRDELTDQDWIEQEPHRHEISSLLFLPLVKEDEWPQMVDLIAAHHKSIKKDRSGRGLIDLVREYGPNRVFERHQEEWATWGPEAIGIAAAFGVEQQSIDEEARRDAFDFALSHCRRNEDGWSALRGVMMSADHFASNYTHDAADEVDNLHQEPNLTGYRENSGPYTTSALYPLSRMDTDDERPHTLVTAPTGAGKTNFLLGRCNGRVFYTLPFQASINAMYRRIQTDLAEHFDAPADVRRLHATSRIELDDENFEEDPDLQRHPGASVKVMTPYQMASTVFGTAGYEAMALDLQGNDVILDEVHTYDGVARSMVLQIVRMLVELGCRVHIGTATIPSALSEALMDVLGGEGQVQRVRLDDETLDTFNRHRIHKCSSLDAAWTELDDLLEKGRRVLFVSNQVDNAQQRFRTVRERYPDVPAMLIHSRYKRQDRTELEDKIEVFEQQEGPCVVCATQVVEVSLDISFDAMITDAAPLDGMIQRFGRVNRQRSEETIGRLKPIYVIAPPEDDAAILPYDAETVRSSFKALPADGEVLREANVQDRIDDVYPEVEIPEVDTHFIWQDGRYRIQKLQHRPKSVLLKALNINSETCILRSEMHQYTDAGWEERQQMHIPVPVSFTRFEEEWGRLPDIGQEPLCAPDHLYDPDGLRLGLTTQLPDDTSPNIL